MDRPGAPSFRERVVALVRCIHVIHSDGGLAPEGDPVRVVVQRGLLTAVGWAPAID